MVLDKKRSPATKVEKSGFLTKYPEKVTSWHVLATDGSYRNKPFYIDKSGTKSRFKHAKMTKMTKST